MPDVPDYVSAVLLPQWEMRTFLSKDKWFQRPEAPSSSDTSVSEELSEEPERLLPRFLPFPLMHLRTWLWLHSEELSCRRDRFRRRTASSVLLPLSSSSSSSSLCCDLCRFRARRELDREAR